MYPPQVSQTHSLLKPALALEESKLHPGRIEWGLFEREVAWFLCCSQLEIQSLLVMILDNSALQMAL